MSDNRSQQEKAKRLLASAANSAKQLESDVRELVAMRAWDALGHENFSTMWSVETGLPCPTYVHVLAVEAMVAEGVNTAYSRSLKNGHSRMDIALAIGLPVEVWGDGTRHSRMATTLIMQLQHGVPADKVRKTPAGAPLRAIINEYGTKPYEPRGRRHPRRMGKGDDELVSEGFGILKSQADEIEEIARQADLPKAEIYRQAVAEYLDRIRESRKVAS